MAGRDLTVRFLGDAGGLGQSVATAGSTMTGFGQNVAAAGSKMSVFGGELNQAGIKLTGLGRESDQADSKLRQLGTGAGAGIASEVGRVGQALQGLGRESDQANTKLRKMGDGVASSLGSELNKAESQLDGFTSKLGTAAKAAGVAAGAAGGAALASGFAASLDIEVSTRKLEAQLGGASEMSRAAGEVAGSLYANSYGESLGQVSEAVRSVIQSGALMEDAVNSQIESVTARAMSLGQAFDQDVGEVMRAVAQMVRTDMAPSAEAALDVLARGFQTGGDKAQDLLDTFNEYGTQFRKLGLDGQTAMGLISQGLQAGARDADVVADAIKEFSIRAIDGSATTVKAFQDLGLNAQEMTAKIAAGGPAASGALQLILDKIRGVEEPAKRAEIAFGLFGTQSEDLGAALLALDPSKAAQGLGNVAGAAERLDKTISDTAQAKITGMQRAFEAWTVSLVATQGPLGTVAAGVMAFAPGGLDIAGNIGMIALATKGMGLSALTATPFVRGLWVALTGPIGLAVLAIGAAVALIIIHWDTIKRWATETIPNAVRDGFNAAGAAVWHWASVTVPEAVRGGLGAASQAVWHWASVTVPESVRTGLTAAGQAVWHWASVTVPDNVRGGLDAAGQAVWHWASVTVPENVRNGLTTAGEAVWHWASVTVPDGIKNGLGNAGRMLYDSGVAIVSGFWDGLVARWNQMVDWVRQGLASLRALFPGSPAKEGPFSGRGWVTHSGRAITGDFAASIRRGIPQVVRAGKQMAVSLHKQTSVAPTQLARWGNLTTRHGFGGGSMASITRQGLVRTQGSEEPISQWYHRGLAAGGTGGGGGGQPPIRLDPDSALARLIMELIRKQTRTRGGGDAQLVIGRA